MEGHDGVAAVGGAAGEGVLVVAAFGDAGEFEPVEAAAGRFGDLAEGVRPDGREDGVRGGAAGGGFGDGDGVEAVVLAGGVFNGGVLPVEGVSVGACPCEGYAGVVGVSGKLDVVALAGGGGGSGDSDGVADGGHPDGGGADTSNPVHHGDGVVAFSEACECRLGLEVGAVDGVGVAVARGCGDGDDPVLVSAGGVGCDIGHGLRGRRVHSDVHGVVGVAPVGVGGDEGDHAAVVDLKVLSAGHPVPDVGVESSCGGEGGGVPLAEGGVAGDLDGRQRMDGEMEGHDGVAAVGRGEGLGVVTRGVVNAVVPSV